MAKTRRVRNKSTGRNYRREYDNYQGRPEQIKRRASRNKARRLAKEAGLKVKGKDIKHLDGNPLNNKKSNIAVQSKNKNRSFKRTKNAGKKNRKA